MLFKSEYRLDVAVVVNHGTEDDGNKRDISRLLRSLVPPLLCSSACFMATRTVLFLDQRGSGKCCVTTGNSMTL